MKICVAQTKPVKGDIESNITNHKKLIAFAVAEGVNLIIFPELSLTGYEPQSANELAITKDDSRLDDFQSISDTKSITIGVGIPTKSDGGICISMVIFQPQLPRQVYSKKYLHADEESYFTPGENIAPLINNNPGIALAICYELSVPQHAEDVFKSGAAIYIASVAKTTTGIAKAAERLGCIAKQYTMTVLLSNCVGFMDGVECTGNTAVWNSSGMLLAQLNDTDEGILIIDADTGKITEKAM